jgi:type IV pilus assembly protein PilE
MELMIVTAVVAILAAVALPAYTEYTTRAKLQEATASLSDLRVKMEQYYLDNRRYSSTTGGGTCGLPGGNTPSVPTAKYFTYACASATNTAAGDQSYTVTANGITLQGSGGFVFTIDQSNTKQTTGVGAGWTIPAGNCWVRRKSGDC